MLGTGCLARRNPRRNAKVDEEEDPLVRRKEELVLMDANARANAREVEEGLVREAEEKA